jgi:hypothetical protein
MTMTSNGKRRKWTAQERLRIVVAGLRPASVPPRGHQLTMYYYRTKKLMNPAGCIFDERDSRHYVEQDRRQAEVPRLRCTVGRQCGTLLTRF